MAISDLENHEHFAPSRMGDGRFANGEGDLNIDTSNLGDSGAPALTFNPDNVGGGDSGGGFGDTYVGGLLSDIAGNLSKNAGSIISAVKGNPSGGSQGGGNLNLGKGGSNTGKSTTPPPAPASKTSTMTWVIVGVLGVAAIGTIVYIATKKK